MAVPPRRSKSSIATSHQSGFSLIELIVTMAFMGIVILAIFELFIQVRQVNRAANNYTVATQVAQQIIERYRNTPYNSISVGTQDYGSYLTPYPNLLNPRSATVTITQTDPSGIKQIDVAISYLDRTGIKNVQLTTLIATKGINK